MAARRAKNFKSTVFFVCLTIVELAKYNQTMKGELTLKILETMEDGLIDTLDIFQAFLNAGYGASQKKLDYELKEVRSRRDQKKFSKEEKRHLREQYSKFIYKLKKDDLIKEELEGKKLSLTEAGFKVLFRLKNRKINPLPTTEYKIETGDRIIIVIFDIPETEKKKRAWLRAALTSLGFSLTQKSVWIGKVKIPKNFLDSLADLKLIPYIEIFEITKSGTLRELI